MPQLEPASPTVPSPARGRSRADASAAGAFASMLCFVCFAEACQDDACKVHVPNACSCKARKTGFPRYEECDLLFAFVSCL